MINLELQQYILLNNMINIKARLLTYNTFNLRLK